MRRLLRLVRGEPATGFSGIEGIEVFSDRVQPHSPGLASRMWYGGASLRSAQWAGENAMNFLTSSVVKVEESADFADIQLSHVRAFRAARPGGERARVSQGLVVIPTDTASAEQRARYHAYVECRLPRTASPQGPARRLFAPRPGGHVGADRGAPARARRLPGGRGGRLRAAVQLRARRLRADPHRHRDPARLGPALGWSPAG